MALRLTALELGKLKANILNGDALIVLGAGVSMQLSQSKFSLWPHLLRDFMKSWWTRCPDENWSTALPLMSLANAWSSEAYVAAASWFEIMEKKERRLSYPLSSRWVYKWVDDRLGSMGVVNTARGMNPHVKELVSALRLIRETKPGVSNLVATTNFDDLAFQQLGFRQVFLPDGKVVDGAGVSTGAWDATISDRDAKAGLWHLHGHYKHPKTMVFGPVGYHRANSDYATLNELITKFMLKTVLFVGCSIEGILDPHLLEIYENLSGYVGSCPYFHVQLEVEEQQLHLKAAARLKEVSAAVSMKGPSKLEDVIKIHSYPKYEQLGKTLRSLLR